MRYAAAFVLLLATGIDGAQAKDIAPHVLLLDAAVVGADVVAVGERGTIIRSSDSGKTWDAILSPTSATLTGVSFAADNQHGWAVGHDAVILSTSDAGRSWRKQWQGPDLENSFLDVCAVDAARVFAIGAYGLCLTTTDAGRNWAEQKPVDEDMHLNRITCGPSGTLYIAGERGTLLRSTDTGRTWLRIDSPYDGSFYGILPLGPKSLVAYGLRGRVFSSMNDGDDWKPARLDRPMLIATALQTKSGMLLLAGQAGAFYVSRDAGVSFQPAAVALKDAVSELLEAPDGTFLAFGEVGVTAIDPARLASNAPLAAQAPPAAPRR